MANKQIYQLTETLSVSPDDWLAIDLDSSNLTRKARVGNVFSVSEGSSYTGGTANGIMFNDGNTFATDANLTWDGSALGAGDISFRPLDSVPSIQGVYFKGTTGGNWQIAATNSVTYIGASNNIQIWSNGVYRGSIQAAGWHIGDSQISPSAKLHTTLSSDIVGNRLDLSNGQTEDAFQINSYGNTGGDVLRVEDDGKLVLGNDVTLYRSGANLLAIDDSVRMAGRLGVNLGLTGIPDFNLDVAAASNPYVNARFKGSGDEGLFIGAITTAYQYIGGNSYYRNSNQWTPKDTGASSIIFDDGEIIFNSNTGLTVDVDFAPTEIARINTTGVGIGTTSPDTTLHAVGGVTDGIGGTRVLELEAALPSLWFKDTNGGGSGLSLNKYGNSFYFSNTNSSGAHQNYAGLIQLSTGMWTIGSGNNPLGQLDVKVQNAASIGQVINLANGQTADAFQINSYGNTGGDLLKVTSDGRLVAYEKLVISDVTRSARIWQNGTQLYLQYSTDDGVTSSSTLSQTRLDQALHALYTRTAIGAYPLTTEQFSVTINNAAWTGQSINLANGQTADAFQINSYGNTGGDVFRVNSSGNILAISGSAASPSYSFVGDTDTGIFSPYANAIMIVGGGNSYAEFSTGSIQIHKPIRQNTGYGAANIGFQWTGDTDSGVIHGSNADEIGIATGGIQRFLVSNSGINMSNLPTSSAGLSSGDLWNDSGTVKIV